jgi:hypothetical protein
VADAATEFEALARALKDAGETELRRELYKALNDAAKPVIRNIRAGLGDYMPDRYAAVLDADLKLTVSKRTGTNPGVTLLGRAAAGYGPGSRRSLTGRKVKRVNAGLLTHPVFGNREVWRTQTDGMKPGFFDAPVARSGPEVRRQIVAALHRVIGKIYAAP